MLAEHWKISSRTSLSYFTRSGAMDVTFLQLFTAMLGNHSQNARDPTIWCYCNASFYVLQYMSFYDTLWLRSLSYFPAVSRLFIYFFPIDYLKFRIKTCSIRMLMFWEEDTNNLIDTHGLVVTLGFGAPTDNASSNPDCNICTLHCTLHLFLVTFSLLSIKTSSYPVIDLALQE